MNNIFTRISAILAFGMVASTALVSPAFAHHPLGGEVPQSLMHGLLSGIGHPIIGFDHLAFVLGIGLLGAIQGGRVLLPAGFVAGTALGTMMILGGITLVGVEPIITLSILLLGVLVMIGRKVQTALGSIVAVIIAGGAGLFHGWAYGESVIGAEATPIIAYIIGFAATQMVIALAAMYVAQWTMGRETASDLKLRLAGAMVAGVGLTYLVELAEAAIFAPL